MAIEHSVSGVVDSRATPGGTPAPESRGAAPASRPGNRAADGGPLPLSREAKRIRDGLGIPITAVAGVEREERAYLHDHSLALNRVIVADGVDTGIWSFLRAYLPAATFEGLRSRARVAFSPLWGRDDLAMLEEKDLRGLQEEWLSRMKAHPRWSGATRSIREEVDYAGIWRDILGGDFDLRGRGAEYTKGMESFQASRWLGARTLLDLLGARDGRPGLYLDALGGDGYVWRLLEAEKGVAAARMVIVEEEGLFFEGAEVPAAVHALMDGVAAVEPRAVVLLVHPEEGDSEAKELQGERRLGARLLTRPDGELVVSESVSLAAEELLHLVHAGEAVWLFGTGAADRAVEAVAAGAETDGGALIVTNDISPHMFYRAGVWGLPSREDATRLSRTFIPGSLDGVMFSYGTHHVPDMFAAVSEACEVLRPEGVVVVHDFFDEGPAGQWFHHVVDKHSKTGHDIPHIGPVQMATVLFAGGFQDVELHETQDPFLFACDGETVKAKDLALNYLLGMYGMGVSFAGRMDEFEQIVKTVLTYPEVGETPIFTDAFVYIPRRAVVARARKPAAGQKPHYSESDLVLIRGITELFRQEPDEIMRRSGAPEEIREYWFWSDGTRWGVTPEHQRAWLDWAKTVL
ncbi:MAG: methyltransferase domain-containing protein [Gemmatimonadetes bacterium]|nr:methyltransferase domain-containing protein [Gemmatimonadota bacterium]